MSSGGAEQRRVQVPGLSPATSYNLRVTVVTSAGSTSHIYSFSTLTTHGGEYHYWYKFLVHFS